MSNDVDAEPMAVPRDARTSVAENVCKVVSNDPVNDQYRLLVLDAPPPALQAEPGQFFHLLCPVTEDSQPFLRRPMSVYRVTPEAARVEFLYKETGAGTRAMAGLRPGDAFNILGPLGVGFTIAQEWRSIVLLARGVGLATLAPLAQAAAGRGVGVTAILSAREPKYLMSLDYMRSHGAELITVTDSDGTSGVGQVEAILLNLIEAGRADAIFTCGSNRLMLLAQRLGRRYGIPGQVAMEQQMACGLGMCFCCVRSFRADDRTVYRRVCCEGPVFDLQEATSW